MTDPAAPPPHSARPASVPRWRPRQVRVRQLPVPRRMGLAYHRDCKAARSTWKGLRVQRHPLHVEHWHWQWQCRWAEHWSPIQLHEFTLNGASQRGNRASGVTPPWKRAEVCCAPGAAELCMEQLTLAWHKVDDECWKDARRVPDDQLHSARCAQRRRRAHSSACGTRAQARRAAGWPSAGRAQRARRASSGCRAWRLDMRGCDGAGDEKEEEGGTMS